MAAVGGGGKVGCFIVRARCFLQNARPLAKGLRASGKRVDAFEKYP